MPFAIKTTLATDLVPEPQETTQPALPQFPFSMGLTAGSHPAEVNADWKRACEYDPGPTPLSPYHSQSRSRIDFSRHSHCSKDNKTTTLSSSW